MRQIVQNYKEGTLKIETVPEPALKSGGVLVQTYHSLISAGTEKMKVDDAKKSILGMAKARPEKVKQVLETFKQQGPIATYRKVMNRLDSFTPLGYSLAGKVIALGKGVVDFKVGDMVACAGAGIANHAEINWVPVNLCAKLPKVVQGVNGDSHGYLSTEQAAFTTVGAIAMQGVRQAEVHVGETVAVIGLGLVGLISCLILKAAGCKVLGLDIDNAKVNLANDIGIDSTGVIGSIDPVQTAKSFSDGYGVDAVIVTTGTSSNEPITTAGLIARDRGTIVDVGINKMDIPWELYFSKELVLKQSRSYGPGRYDPNYEMNGQDYPIGYVRWTENRNMLSFLDLMARGKIDISTLVTHRFDFSDAVNAYKSIEGENSGFYVGIVMKYDTGEETLRRSRVSTLKIGPVKRSSGVNLGMIGSGNFARTMLLPYLKGSNIGLIGIATANGISARDTARKFGFNICTTDYHELLNDDSINTILIATRHNLHGKMVVEALEAGKHVYTEKPLCITAEELASIDDLLSGGNRRDAASQKMSGYDYTKPIVMVGFNRRFAPLVRGMKAFFGARKEPMIMHYRVNAGFMLKTDWYQDKQIGGGRIIGEVCHFIDTFQYLTDAIPLNVFAQTIKTNNKSTTCEDNVIITIQFSDGSIGSITYLANGDPRFPKEYCEVFCENRVAVMDNFSQLTTMANGKKKVKKTVVQDKGHKAEMRVLIDTITNHKPAPISFESIYATTMTSFKIHESLESREMVELQ